MRSQPKQASSSEQRADEEGSVSAPGGSKRRRGLTAQRRVLIDGHGLSKKHRHTYVQGQTNQRIIPTTRKAKLLDTMACRLGYARSDHCAAEAFFR